MKNKKLKKICKMKNEKINQIGTEEPFQMMKFKIAHNLPRLRYVDNVKNNNSRLYCEQNKLNHEPWSAHRILQNTYIIIQKL